MLFNLSATWQYQSASNTAPGNPATVTVPSSSWSGPSAAPFGTAGSARPATAVATAWATNTGLWIQRNVTTSGDNDVVLTGNIENALYVYWDGVYIGGINEANADLTGDPRSWSVVIPKAQATAATHSLAILCLDETGGGDGTTYVSCQADYANAMMTVQPTAPVTETLQWLTDILNSENGTEERNQLRLSPRQKFKLIYPTNPDGAMQRTFNSLYAAKSKDWLLPVWTQGQNVGAVTADVRSLSLTTANYDLRSGLALLWQAHDNWQLIGVDSIGSGTVALAGRAQAFTNAWFIPVVNAFLPENGAKRLDGTKAAFELTFQVKDVPSLTVSAPTSFTSPYLSDPVDLYTFQGEAFGKELSDDIIGRQALTDEDIGVISYFAPWLFNRTARDHQVMCPTRSEAWSVRQRLYRHAGQFRGFWSPTFENDLRWTSTGNITTSLAVSSDSIRRSGSVRRHIAVETSAGWYCAAINSTTTTSSTVTTLNLDRSLGIAAKDILRVCWLGAKRLNTDSIDIQWIGAGICTVSFRVLELQP